VTLADGSSILSERFETTAANVCASKIPPLVLQVLVGLALPLG
jgi:hypothetical protein